MTEIVDMFLDIHRNFHGLVIVDVCKCSKHAMVEMYRGRTCRKWSAIQDRIVGLGCWIRGMSGSFRRRLLSLGCFNVFLNYGLIIERGDSGEWPQSKTYTPRQRLEEMFKACYGWETTDLGLHRLAAVRAHAHAALIPR